MNRQSMLSRVLIHESGGCLINCLVSNNHLVITLTRGRCLRLPYTSCVNFGYRVFPQQILRVSRIKNIAGRMINHSHLCVTGFSIRE